MRNVANSHTTAVEPSVLFVQVDGTRELPVFNVTLPTGSK
jgi:hypothetical protein